MKVTLTVSVPSKHCGRETKRTAASAVALVASALPLLYFGILARPSHDESLVEPVSRTREHLPPGSDSSHPASRQLGAGVALDSAVIRRTANDAAEG
jgi:hypothetical protein